MSAKVRGTRSSSSIHKASGDAEVLPQLGDATTTVFLLRDYEKFGLTERVCYHFDLTEAGLGRDDDSVQNKSLDSSGRQLTSAASAISSSAASSTSASTVTAASHTIQSSEICGVTSLLECAPATPWHRLTKRQKRALKNELRSFNLAAETFRQSKGTPCYQPKHLPLPLQPSSRVFFAYEVTRIAFCVDASPSMTSMFGINGSGVSSHSSGPCCPIDRLPEMARTFFESLVQPISAPSLAGTGIWRPVLSVTVIAVYPMGTKAETSLLVRGYRVDSVEAAKTLANNIEKWIHSDVEVGITERLIRPHEVRTWSMPLYSSSLRHILEAADYSLSVLPSNARPLIVVATDCRSVSCDGVVDVFLDIDRVDIPVVVLDLSETETHAMENGNIVPPFKEKSDWNFLTYDPGGPADFPLHLSDDARALLDACRATGGCLMDWKLLKEKSESFSGQQGPSSDSPAPYQTSFKLKFVKMNGIQSLTLFSLSPLSPTPHANWGKLAPPQYLKENLGMGSSPTPTFGTTETLTFSGHETFAKQSSDPRRAVGFDLSSSLKKSQHNHSRTTFSTYFVSPVRIKALIIMRITEGYRAKLYRVSPKDADKVFIQFTLPLEMGTVLHYELSYKALSTHNHMVGSAHIKIELSGDPTFVQTVKNDFLKQGVENRPITMAQKVSSRLCNVMRWIRREDILQSYLSPPSKWSDQLSSPDSPFARRLGSMSVLQRRRHFRSDEFDVICTGNMPYTIDPSLLSEFSSTDNGEQQLLDLLHEWSTQVVNKEKTRYVKATTAPDGTTLYCMIEVRQSDMAPRLFTVIMEFFGGTDPVARLSLLADLHREIEELRDVQVLSKQMGPFLIGTSYNAKCFKKNVEFQNHFARWDLVKDPELLPLVMKRRTEIGRFHLMQSDENAAIFAKVVPEKIHDLAGDLVQYQIAILPDRVVVALHMEGECGLFFPFGRGGEAKLFNGIVKVLRRRDQECGRALRSRTNLLLVLQSESTSSQNQFNESHKESVKRMLQYSSRVSRKLRFFNQSASGANDVLSKIIESLLSSGSFNVRAAKLSIESQEKINDEDEGLWFVIQFDRHTMSIAHLSVVDKIDDNQDSIFHTYRTLTFFTSGISDLYSKRDDKDDDDSVDSHVSEYLCVTEFAERFEAAEIDNFASAAYLALRQDVSMIERFEKEDFDMIQQSLEYVEVASVLVAGHGFQEDASIADGDTRLTQLIGTILSPIPGDDSCLFYSGAEVLEAYSISDGDAVSVDTLEGGTVTAHENLAEVDADDIDLQQSSSFPVENINDTTSADTGISQPPIFVRFKLDGIPVSFAALNSIPRSSTLVAEMSLVKRRGTTSSANMGTSLPWSHQAVASELNVLLKWYVAEQTIERLRHRGASISLDDLTLVKKCMKRVQTVLSFAIEVFFYISKLDMIVPASAPAGGESEVEEGFGILLEYLTENSAFRFRALSNENFVVARPEDDQSLEFWCFIDVQTAEGLISSEIYHPDGEEKAVEVMSQVHAAIRSTIHRANQYLMLKSLHMNRTATRYLIPRAKGSDDELSNEDHEVSFSLGSFACPVVFKYSFDLFHRCASNPNQVARSLEATVLHSFAVSNRAGVFVYKDEVGGIFYMSLEARGSGTDVEGQVELLVHGIHSPGPSVTKQLKALLQKRLLLIAVEMLSSVLTKNPHFRVTRADLDFLRTYDDEWASLDKEREQSKNYECVFAFPDIVNDPCMVLLMLRQDLCGSTYFHRLNDIGERVSLPISESKKLPSGGSLLNWNQHTFTLYYNNAPSKLNQRFQGASTLTEKGAALCRQIGSGIAVLEITLLRANGTHVEDVSFGDPSEFTISSAEQDLRFRRLETFPTASDKICTKIRVIDTGLSREHLFEWIELSLNQALAAWIVERSIQRSKLPHPSSILRLEIPTPEVQRLFAIEKVCPGLPALIHILDSSSSLPHPAVSHTECRGMIRSSAISTKTLELLESSILGSIFKDTNSGEIMRKAQPNLFTLRVPKSGKPESVRLSWNAKMRKTIVHAVSSDGTERIIEDSPIDCPEYLSFFLLTKLGEKADHIDHGLQLYKEVMVHDGMSDRSASIALLESLKEQNKTAFMRSFAFVLSVKRNQRSLWTYNWNQNLAKSVSSRIRESEVMNLGNAGRISHTLQFRILRILAPPAKAHEFKPEQNTGAGASTTREHNAHTKTELATEQPTTMRRIRRPTVMRRPKLVGKSVEGSAMQAVAASRKRASSNQFKNIASTTPSRRQPSGAPIREGGRSSIMKTPPNTSEARIRQFGRPPSSSRRSKEIQEKDEILSRVKKDFALMYKFENWQLKRASSLYRGANLLLTNLWWPRNNGEKVPRGVAEFILTQSPLAWSEECLAPPFPEGLTDVLVPIFARWIATFTPGLQIVSTDTRANQHGSMLLASDIKNVRSVKCQTVVKISRVQNSGMSNTMIRCQGWLLTLPRRRRKDQLKKSESNISNAYLRERDSIGMDKLASDVQRSLFLESLLFDFSASMVERAVRLVDERIENEELIPTLRELMTRYPLIQQKRMPMLNYRAFEAHINLKSFQNKMIDQFDANSLLQGLYAVAEERDLIRCGDGICFKRGVSVKGSQSTFFLVSHPVDASAMRLLFLCRTQGRKLEDFMFREGSNVAIHILDNIVLEATDLVYEELNFISKKLHKDALWNSLSTKAVRHRKTLENVMDTLAEFIVRSIAQSLQDNNVREDAVDVMNSMLDRDSGIDWRACCASMKKQAAFSPSWSFNGVAFSTHLFYVESNNTFLLLEVDPAGNLLRSDTVEKEDTVTAVRQRQMTIQIFANYVLHFILRRLL